MKDFKKALIASISFVTLIIILSVAVIVPYIYYSTDRMLKDDLQGTIDYLIVGASHGKYSFVPSILDKELGCHSYNLSVNSATFKGREAVFVEEIGRNPIKTVVIDLSHDAFSRSKYSKEGSANVIYALSRMSPILHYIKENVCLDDLEYIYAYHFGRGLDNMLVSIAAVIQNGNRDDISSVIKKALLTENNRRNKGYAEQIKVSAQLNEEEVKTLHNSELIDMNFQTYNVEALEEIVKDCNENGARVIFVTVPVSDACIWKYSNWDDYSKKVRGLCKRYGTELYDFNLIKNRYQLFSDDESYWGETHLCPEGAETFSKLYTDVVKRVEKGEDVSNLFYGSYEEMKENSPYHFFAQRN